MQFFTVVINSDDIFCIAEIRKQEAQRATYRAPEYNLQLFWGISQGEHFVYWSAGKTQTW